MPCETNIQDVSPEKPFRWVPDDRALNKDVGNESNAFIVDLKQLCPTLNVVTFKHLLTQYILAGTKEEAKPFLILMASQLNISNERIDKALLRKVEKFRKKHWKQIKSKMELKQDELFEEAKREFRKDRAIFGKILLALSKKGIYLEAFIFQSNYHYSVNQANVVGLPKWRRPLSIGFFHYFLYLVLT